VAGSAIAGVSIHVSRSERTRRFMMAIPDDSYG
jgi:hypothetical protein